MLEPSRMIFGTLVILGLGVLYELGLYLGAIRALLVLVGILHHVGALVKVGILIGGFLVRLGVLK